MRLTTTEAVEAYKDMLFRIAFHICRCEADADDAVQDCFVKYHTANMEYESTEHLKAWLIRVTINLAKNITKSFWRRNRENWEEYMADVPSTTAALSLCFRSGSGAKHPHIYAEKLNNIHMTILLRDGHFYFFTAKVILI